jgi:phage-related minor tail protein
MEDMDSTIPLPRLELRRLGDELAAALRAVTHARAATDPFQVLGQLTVAIEGLTATQHELVNVLLDQGRSWAEVGDALSTSAAAAERRYPRRDRRNTETAH